MIVISKHSKRAEPTYLFLQWMVDRATQKRLFGAAKGAGVPVRQSTWAMPELKQSRFAGLYEAMRDSLAHGQAKPKAARIFEIAGMPPADAEITISQGAFGPAGRS